MAQHANEPSSGGKPAQEKPAEQPKPNKPNIPGGYQPGVGTGGVLPKLPPQFEPEPGGPGIMPEKVYKE